ncbi:MAG TPA: catalase-peroxidase, partial [Arthrobacter bacterium]|nr:catalase-peroxidase [Arthrobacter sp.]
DTITSGLEVTWTDKPTQWSNRFFEILFAHEWELVESPAGAKQWVAKDSPEIIPDAHDPEKKHRPTMLTTDLSLRVDPIYGEISRRFLENPDEFALVFAKAWYKLLHRDMGPVGRHLLGPWVPEAQLWQDPIPAVDHELIDEQDTASLKARLLDSGLSVSQLAGTAWSAASTFRKTDRRGGANGARIRLEPQRGWEGNQPEQLTTVLQALETVQQQFNSAQTNGKKVSLADLIVLGGCAAVEKAAQDAGFAVTVPFRPGRTDAAQDQTDVESFEYLQPRADGFRNYVRPGEKLQPETLLIDKAYLLDLSAPEMTALVGGMRALGTNVGGSGHGVLTDRPQVLTNDFFVNLLSPGTRWKASEGDEDVYEISDVTTGELKWTATPVDLVFGSNSQLRALAEVYASDDAREKFVNDFVTAWAKVMELDRFDLY